MKNNRPRISIGMPVYNGERFVKAAIDSFLAQTFEDFELVISDNASTDCTQEICKLYAARDHRIRYYRNEQNIGGHRNFNRVFELARGEYFRWAAHDDMCAPNCLEECVKVLEQNPSIDLCYTKTKIIDEQGTVLDKNCDDNLQTNSPKPQVRFGALALIKVHQCQQLHGLVRKSTLAVTPLLGNYSGADRVLVARLALLGQFYEIPEYLFFSRDHPHRSTRAMASPYLRTTWFDPTKQGKLVFPKWRMFFGYFLAVQQAPLRLYEKASCYLHLVMWLKMHWNSMVKELVKAMVWPIYFSVHHNSSAEKNTRIV